MAEALDPETARRLREYFARRREDVLSFTRALCEIESPSGDLAGSRAVSDLLAAAAEASPGVVSVERIEAPDGYGVHFRLRAFGPADGRARPLLLLGHTDTVHPLGTLAARPWREEGGRVYAPGVFDMKASCAAAIETVRACAELGLRPRRPVTLLLTCDEETGSFSGRALVEEEARAAEAVLVLEPPAPGGRAKTARKGTGIFTLRAEGVAAHAGLDPERGASAVHEIARQIGRLCELADPARGTTVNVGVVEGGTRANVVAERATAEVDVRFSTTDEASRLEASILNSQSFDPRVRLAVSGGINRPPLERTPRVEELYQKAWAAAAALDFELGEASVGGASDGNFAAAVGAAVLDGLGVDGDGAHAAHEHIQQDALARRGALLAALIATL